MRALLLSLLSLCSLCGLLSAAWAWPVEAGSWRAAEGLVGERTAQAVAVGGDGQLYVAGAGQVYRSAPGEAAFQWVGRYAPELRWDEDQGIEASGPFPQAFLDAVAEEAQRALEGDGAQELSAESVTEDVVQSLLRGYIEEPEPEAHSPFRVLALVPSDRGAWLATAAGLFRIDAQGVQGPLGPAVEARDLAWTAQTLWVATAQGLFSHDASGAWLRRWHQPVTQVAAGPQGLFFISEGALWRWAQGEAQPQRLPDPPSAQGQQLAADAQGLWLASTLALYRYTAAGWRLCPALPDTLVSLQTAQDGRLLAVGERALYVSDAQCGGFQRMEAPWPGAVQLSQMVEQGEDLWLASGAGLHRRVAQDQRSFDAGRVDAYRRAVRALPSLDTVVREALAYNRLDQAAMSYGYRPVLRWLLPDLTFRYESFGRRMEANPTILGGDPVWTIDSWRPHWVVMLDWTIRFDIFTALFDVEREGSVQALQQGDDDLFAADDQPEAGAQEAQLEAQEESIAGLEGADDLNLIGEDPSIEPGFDAVDYDPFGDDLGFSLDDDFDADLGTISDDRAFSMLAVERRQAARDRQLLMERLSALYRERLQLMFKLWVELPIEGRYLAEVLRLDEIDAALDAATGGAFTRTLYRP